MRDTWHFISAQQASTQEDKFAMLGTSSLVASFSLAMLPPVTLLFLYTFSKNECNHYSTKVRVQKCFLKKIIENSIKGLSLAYCFGLAASYWIMSYCSRCFCKVQNFDKIYHLVEDRIDYHLQHNLAPWLFSVPFHAMRGQHQRLDKLLTSLTSVTWLCGFKVLYLFSHLLILKYGKQYISIILNCTLRSSISDRRKDC